MKATRISTRSSAANAKGLGSSRSGVSHWWMQRLTAMGMIPLTLYCLTGFVLNAGADQETARAWLSEPTNTVAMLLLLATGFYHAALGLQVVVEDYMASKTRRLLTLALVQMTLTALAVLSVYSVLMIALGRGAP